MPCVVEILTAVQPDVSREKYGPQVGFFSRGGAGHSEASAACPPKQGHYLEDRFSSLAIVRRDVTFGSFQPFARTAFSTDLEMRRQSADVTGLPCSKLRMR